MVVGGSPSWSSYGDFSTGIYRYIKKRCRENSLAWVRRIVFSRLFFKKGTFSMSIGWRASGHETKHRGHQQGLKQCFMFDGTTFMRESIKRSFLISDLLTTLQADSFSPRVYLIYSRCSACVEEVRSFERVHHKKIVLYLCRDSLKQDNSGLLQVYQISIWSFLRISPQIHNHSPAIHREFANRYRNVLSIICEASIIMTRFILIIIICAFAGNHQFDFEVWVIVYPK